MHRRARILLALDFKVLPYGSWRLARRILILSRGDGHRRIVILGVIWYERRQVHLPHAARGSAISPSSSLNPEFSTNRQ